MDGFEVSSIQKLAEGANVQLISLLFALTVVFHTIWCVIQRPKLPHNAPRQHKKDWPVVGAIKFFTARWELFKDVATTFPTGNMSFHVGRHVVVAVTGAKNRSIFLEDRRLRLGEAYAVLFGHSPGIEPHLDNDSTGTGEEREKDESVANMGEFNAWFNNRMARALRTENLSTNLPYMIRDVRAGIEGIAEASDELTNPFFSMYAIVFQITFRMLGCTEIADDDALRANTLQLYESLESSAGMSMILTPWWLPTVSRFRRLWNGAKLYITVQKIIEERKKKNIRYKDTLQALIDQGDNEDKIVRFIISVIYSGQVNTGLNAAYVLCYLATNRLWMQRIRLEVEAVANKYDSDVSKSFWHKLENVPLVAWETEFPLLDLCLRESIRLSLHGAAFRWNSTVHDIPLGHGGENLPSDAFLAYHMSDVHRNPDIYSDPEAFDPGRYLPDRAEDRRSPYAFIGWGAARHPCPGQRFAKFEIALITSHFLACFREFTICTKDRQRLDIVPLASLNAVVTERPLTETLIDFRTQK